MPGRAFVDTNVLVYGVDVADARKQRVALALLEARSSEIAISTQVLAEFYVVVTRRLTPPLSPEDATVAVEGLAELPVVVTDADLVRSGIAISREARISFWDGLIVAAARAANCDTLLTEDLATGSVIAGVAIIDPFAAQL